jgi:hypothetical protein
MHALNIPFNDTCNGHGILSYASDASLGDNQQCHNNCTTCCFCIACMESVQCMQMKWPTDVTVDLKRFADPPPAVKHCLSASIPFSRAQPLFLSAA